LAITLHLHIPLCSFSVTLEIRLTDKGDPMKTATLLLVMLVVMHAISVINILLFDGHLNDLVFFFNSAICFAAVAFYLWKK
jgi:hypothetical protein